jgi:hypothetical protein
VIKALKTASFLFLFSFLILSHFSSDSLVFAEEGFTMQERKWIPIFGQARPQDELNSLTFSDLSQMNDESSALVDQDIQIQGYPKRETLDSFIIMQDPFDPPSHCHNCVDEVASLSPRVFAPREVVRKLKKGLVRVQGKPVFYFDRSDEPVKLGPILEIEATAILFPEAR